MTLVVIVTFNWGSKYPPLYVNRLARGVARNLTLPYRFVCVSDRPQQYEEPVEQFAIVDHSLTKIPGCFARLRLFDPEWQRTLGIAEGQRVMVLDLDIVITGPIDDLVSRPDDFAILMDVNAPDHPTRGNGSTWLTRGGYRPDVWEGFNLEAAAKLPHAAFVDDQGWFQDRIPDAGEITERDGVWAYAKGRWPGGKDMPKDARIVCFPGRRDPSQFENLRWVRDHWR